LQERGRSKEQTWLGTICKAAETHVLPYAAPKVDSKAAAGTRRLGEYFRGPTSSYFGVRGMSWLLLKAIY
jgi:hypothetical protein